MANSDEGSMRFNFWFLVLLAALIGQSALAQTVAQKYGGTDSGVWVHFPTPGALPVTIIDVPVMPGGKGTEPGSFGEIGNDHWNHSKSTLTSTNSTTTIIADTKTFAKLQTVTVSMPTPPNEKHWEAQGKAVVGGRVSASLEDAHGTCHALASSKTAIVYGAVAVESLSVQGVALAHATSTHVGASVEIGRFGGVGFSISYAAAGTGEQDKALGDQKTGVQSRADQAIIDYTQNGDMAYAYQAVVGGPNASCALSADPKGSAVVTFILVNGY